MTITGMDDVKFFIDGVQIGTARAIDAKVEREKTTSSLVNVYEMGAEPRRLGYEGSVTIEPGSLVATYPYIKVPYPSKRPKSKRLQKKQYRKWMKANGVPL